jgi:hypothetical protein
MASRTKAKATAPVAPIETIMAKDSMPMLLPPNVVTELMNSAYDDTATGSKLTERGSQRAVCAVMYHMYQVISDGKCNHALRDCALASNHGKDTREAINAIMVAHFVPAAETNSDMGDDEVGSIKDTRDKHVRLIKRSVTTAGVLEASGVVAADFNHTTGMFTVPSKIMYPADAAALDRLLDNAFIDLDGQTISFHGRTSKGKTRVINARASIAQVYEINAPKLGNGKRKAVVPGTPPVTQSNAPATDTSVKFTNVEDVAARVPVIIMIEALHSIIIESGPAEPIARDTYDAKTWNMISALMMRFDESFKAWDAKPVQAKAA